MKNANSMIRMVEKKFGLDHYDSLEDYANVWVKDFSATRQAHYGLCIKYAGVREKAHIRLTFEKSTNLLLRWSFCYENGVCLYNDSKPEVKYCNGDIGLVNIGGVGPKIANRHVKFFATILQELQERIEDEEHEPTNPREGRTAEYLDKTQRMVY